MFDEAPRIPWLSVECEHVWGWFTDIFNPGGVGMGPYRPAFTEIEAFARLNRLDIKPWEVMAIRALAETYIVWDDEKEKKKAKTGGVKNPVDMTNAAGLRALFEKQGLKKPTKTPGQPRSAKTAE
jgi:hypothetical protein